MFSDLTKANYTIIYVVPLWTYMGLLSMHRPIRFLLAPSKISFKKYFRAQYSYMHVNCIIQGFVDVKQRLPLQSATCTLMYNSIIFLQ